MDKKEETKKIDKKKLEELAKILKEAKKQPIKKEEKKKEEDEEEYFEEEEFFDDSGARFIRQTRHGTLNSGLSRISPVAVNLEKSLEDVSVPNGKKDEELYSAAKYGAKSETSDNKYAVQSPQMIVNPIQRFSGGNVSQFRNEFVTQGAMQAMDPIQDPKKVEYSLPESRLNQDELQFGRKDNEHIRKYK